MVINGTGENYTFYEKFVKNDDFTDKSLNNILSALYQIQKINAQIEIIDFINGIHCFPHKKQLTFNISE
jgi:hypothetical protein